MRKLKPLLAAQLAQRFLEPGDAVLEIGAADGEYTHLYAERVGPTGEVLAVEPNRKVRAQGIKACPGWVSWCAAAVGADEGTVTLHTARRYPKTASLYADNVPHGPAYDVPMTTVDALVAKMRQTPALIQVDAQGAEAAILAGAHRTLALPVVWVVEVWPQGLAHAGASAEVLVAIFQRCGHVPESPSGIAISWTEVGRQAKRSGHARHGHFDLVLIPRQLQMAVSA